MEVFVDGRAIEVPPASTVLEATRAAGREVPTLCFDERLAPFGACRVCLVRVSGAEAPVAACTTPCREGMEVDTGDPAATRTARNVVELVLSELSQAPAPESELGRLATRLKVGEPRWTGARHAGEAGEAGGRHPYLSMDRGLCISCGRCVRACDELQGAFALTATGRGFQSSVAAGLDAGFLDSSCVSCGACADTCPTGAIGERFLAGSAEGRGDGRGTR